MASTRAVGLVSKGQIPEFRKSLSDRSQSLSSGILHVHCVSIRYVKDTYRSCETGSNEARGAAGVQRRGLSKGCRGARPQVEAPAGGISGGLGAMGHGMDFHCAQDPRRVIFDDTACMDLLGALREKEAAEQSVGESSHLQSWLQGEGAGPQKGRCAGLGPEEEEEEE